jgi:hypothetical protein
VEVAERSTVTPYGGLSLAAAFLERFRVAQAIDERVQVLKLHLPFHESDHVLAQALNLYVGGECLAVRNRPGNLRSSNGAAALLEETLPRVKRRFADVLVRADSDFDRRDVREACEAEGAFFAFVAREASNRLAWAEAKKRSRFLKFNEPGHAVRSASGASRFGSSAFRVGLRWSEIERTRGEIRSEGGLGGTWRPPDRPGRSRLGCISASRLPVQRAPGTDSGSISP